MHRTSHASSQLPVTNHVVRSIQHNSFSSLSPSIFLSFSQSYLTIFSNLSRRSQSQPLEIRGANHHSPSWSEEPITAPRDHHSQSSQPLVIRGANHHTLLWSEQPTITASRYRRSQWSQSQVFPVFYREERSQLYTEVLYYHAPPLCKSSVNSSVEHQLPVVNWIFYCHPPPPPPPPFSPPSFPVWWFSGCLWARTNPRGKKRIQIDSVGSILTHITSFEARPRFPEDSYRCSETNTFCSLGGRVVPVSSL